MIKQLTKNLSRAINSPLTDVAEAAPPPTTIDRITEGGFCRVLEDGVTVRITE